MADTNRDGVSTMHHGSAEPTNSDSNNTTSKPARQKRTRSQLNVPDLIQRLPLSRSPPKGTRKAHSKARGILSTPQVGSQPRTSGVSHLSTAGRGEAVSGSDRVVKQEVAGMEVEEDTETSASGRAEMREEEGTKKSLISFASHSGTSQNEDSNSSQSQHTTWLTRTKKRASPDANATCNPASPSSQPQPKRAKVETFRILGREQGHSEYREPLRDPEASTPGQSEGHKLASSMRPTISPSKVASNFPYRARSVPPGIEKEARAIDLTSVHPSPRRSPSKGGVEVRRAPSVPLPDSDRTDLGVSDAAALLQFTNTTPLPTLRANPVFHYTVNFATPRGSATPPRSGFPSASPLSPLTPLPPSPFTTVVGAMKPRRGPSAPQGPRHVTRSVSMKEQRVKGECTEVEDATVSSYTAEAPDATTSTVTAMSPPPITVTSIPHPLKSIGAVTSKSRLLSATRRTTSVSSTPLDSSKLKQTSLNKFIHTKPSVVVAVAAGSSMSSTDTDTGSSSKVAPSSSLSKLPIPASPLKRPSTSQYTRPLQFPLGSTGTGVETGSSREISGRSLTTLSHALDKLVVPPPNRPNTSMGFVRAEKTDEECDEGNRKGKWKANDDTSLPLASTKPTSGTFARPTASSLKRMATVTGYGSMGVTRMRGQVGTAVRGLGKGRRTVGIFGKAGDTASKKTSLPVVAGSPVKGSEGTGDSDRDGWGAGKHKSNLCFGGAVTGEEDVFVSQDVVMQDTSAESSMGGGVAASQKPSLLAVSNAIVGTEIDSTSSPISVDKGKQRAASSSTLNPASSVLHALSESLSSLPQTPTPPKPRPVGTRTGLRSSSAAAGKESPTLDGPGSVGGGSSEMHGSGGAGPNNGTVNGSGGVKKSSLKILKRCAIFVDVRTEQGDDAGSLFVDMLKGLGAKIMGRLGQTCTHIVYKNGLPNTLIRYRLLNDPKPAVVGIAWVVECAEKRAKVDEERFKIDVDVIGVAGSSNKLKRRRTMLPKYLIPVSPGPDYEMTMHVSSEADDDEGGGGIDGSPSQDPDISMRSREEDDLPPLERARKRRSILPGGQTRLIP